MLSFIAYSAKINHINKNLIGIIEVGSFFGFYFFGGKYYENIKEVYYKKAYGFGGIVGIFTVIIIQYIWVGSLPFLNKLALVVTLIGLVFSFKTVYIDSGK